MIRLADPKDLRASVSDGPQSWGEAFGRVVDTTDAMMTSVENVTATQDNYRAAYDDYISEVEKATGQRLSNPMDIRVDTQAFEAKPNPTFSFETGTEFRQDRQKVAMDRFEAERAALLQQYPAQARLIQLDVDGRVKRRMQDADKAAKEALAAPELGPVGRIAAQLVGGIEGSAKDPYQVTMALMGAGGAVGKTVAGRIGQVMVQEALLNGGQELVLQAASQERKRAAGLEHGMKDALANAGIAATFGALFGGTIQGGAELARIFKLGEGGAEAATRVLDGKPEPGDVERLSSAMGVELSPDKLDMLTRSFEERQLDELMVPDDPSPAQMRVIEAARRYAEDPDNFPAPELVERMEAEREAQRLLTLSPDDYERIYGGGDANAIDDIADTFFAGDLDQAARTIDAAATSPTPAADLPPVVDRERLDSIAKAQNPVGKKPRTPQSLMHFLAANGGLREDAGELKALGLSRKFIPGRGRLVRQGGRSLDYAREAAAQAGYFDRLYGTADEATAQSTVADLLDLLDQENRGNPVYSSTDQSQLDALADYRQQIQNRDDYREFLGKLEIALREVAPDSQIDDAILVRATDLMIEEDLTPLAAFDRAVLEDEARLADLADELGEGYRDETAYSEIPFFDDGPSGSAASARGAAGTENADGISGAGRADGQGSDQSQSVGPTSPDSIDPTSGQAIAPPVKAEPLDDAAMRDAEMRAGDIVEPQIDANGNPRSLLDFVPVEDGDGNVRLVPTSEALQLADEPDFHADLLEACKL